MNAVENGVSDRQHRHAVMMGHDVLHDAVIGALALAAWREIDRVIEPEAALGAQFAQRGQVPDRRLRVDLCRQDRGIGRHHVIAARTLQRQVGNAEGVILIVHVPVAGVERAFRNAPGQAVRPPPFHLDRDRHLVGEVEDAALTFLQQQRRHQVFEHAARPGQKRAAMADHREGPAQTRPMFLAQIALGDGQETGQPRLRGQQVIAAAVKRLRIGAIADRHQRLFAIDEQAEIHPEGKVARPLGQKPGLQDELVQRLGPGCDRVQDIGGVAHQCRGPGQDLGRVAARGRRVQIARQSPDGRGAADQLPGRDRIGQRSGQAVRHRPGIAVDRLAHRAVQVAQRTAIVAQQLQLGAQDVQRVAQPRRGGHAHRRRVRRPAPQTGGQRDQHPGKIAAVDRRQIGRGQHRQRSGVIPVEEMPAKPLHPFKRGDGGLDPFQRRVQADPAEIMRRHDRHEIQPDIGRRGAFGQFRGWQFLIIVGRQMVGRLVDEFVEIAPDAAGDAPQLGLVLGRDLQLVDRFQRPRGAKGDPGRGDPQRGENHRDRKGGWIDRGRGQDRAAADQGRRDHPAIFGRKPGVVPVADQLRWRPFQQVAPADGQPPQGPEDRVRRRPGPIRDRGQPQPELGERDAGVAQHLVDVIPP